MRCPAYGVTAPNGKLNLPFFEAIRRTIKGNPQWEARLANHNNAIARVNIEENRKRAAIIAQSQRRDRADPRAGLELLIRRAPTGVCASSAS